MPDTFEAVRAEALFVSTLQCSECPSPDRVRGAVAATLRRLGIQGCAAQVAGEFGDHPEIAAPRMAWALATIRVAYRPRPGRNDRPPTNPLALAG